MTKVLVVVDMQNDFISGVLGTKEAIEIVDNVVEKINNFDGQIVATLDTHKTNYLKTPEGKKLPVPHCIRMTQGWLINEQVLTALNKKSAKMHEKNTFGSTRLLNMLRKIDDEYSDIEVTLIGLDSDICVISNAIMLKNFYPDIKVIVDASCCAGSTPEKHKAALEIMKSCQIDVIGE